MRSYGVDELLFHSVFFQCAREVTLCEWLRCIAWHFTVTFEHIFGVFAHVTQMVVELSSCADDAAFTLL